MYVCMYDVFMYECIYVCMYVWMYVRTYVCMYVCMYAYMPNLPLHVEGYKFLHCTTAYRISELSNHFQKKKKKVKRKENVGIKLRLV